MKPSIQLLNRGPLAALLLFVFTTWGTGAAGTIQTKLFNPEYLEGDCNYHSLTTASDGMIYFTVSTHNRSSSARIYRFDPDNESLRQIGDLGEILEENAAELIPQGKIHTPLVEHEGYLYFATHTSYYDDGLPEVSPGDGRTPYPGGHFMRYHLESGTFEDLAQLQLPSEGIITMTVDKANDTLYGLTWPTGLLLSYNLSEKLLHNWGAVQQRGEWGQLPTEWNFICRTLGMDNGGKLYGSTDTGRIWRFEQGAHRPVHYLRNLDLAQVAPVQEADFEYPSGTHYFWNNWRTIQWNPETESFWGIQGGSSQLFEFIPSSGMLRSVRSVRPDGVPQHTRRNPFRSQLGFMLGPVNTLFYLAHAPGMETEDRPALDTSIHLLTYRIDTEEFHDHGTLVSPLGQRIFFTESIAIGPDDHIYTVAWVESSASMTDSIHATREEGAPEETNKFTYEMQLVQLPKWREFVR